MNAALICLKLQRRIQRGCLIFWILLAGSVLLTVFALINHETRSWAVSTLLVGVLFMLGLNHVRRRRLQTAQLIENPRSVFWAHPTRPFLPFSREPIENCRQLLLHFLDGTSLEIDLSESEMRLFVRWLIKQNPSIRIGELEAAPPTSPIAT